MTKKSLFSVVIILAIISCNDNNAKPDNEFDVTVSDPKLKDIQPTVLFDEAHKNNHQIETTYKPFATLITNDGCSVKSTGKPIDKTALANTDIYICATAMGKEDPGDKSPFTQHNSSMAANPGH